MAAPLRFRRFLEEDARTVASWRYPDPYSAYDLDPHDIRVIRAMLLPGHNYHAILEAGEMVGYFCCGDDARVPGWLYDDDTLDLGVGLRPELTGQGKGHFYLQAVIEHVARQRPGVALRATIASWNLRAIRMCRRAGFEVAGKFTTTRADQTEFAVMVKGCATAAL